MRIITFSFRKTELTAKYQRIHLRCADADRRQHFGRKTEMLPGLQRQLFREDAEVDIAAAETQLNTLLCRM